MYALVESEYGVEVVRLSVEVRLLRVGILGGIATSIDWRVTSDFRSERRPILRVCHLTLM